MDAWERLQSLLETEARGIGCEENLGLIHVYAEILANGGDPDEELSALTAHLRQCPPCADDLAGLVQAVREAVEAPTDPPES